MTLEELQAKLRLAVAEGRIGSPVALRMHLNSGRADEDLQSHVLATMRMARELFDSLPERLMVRGDFDRQATVLVTYASGATLFATLNRAAVDSSNIQLLLIGNHGIANLEPAEWIPESLPEESTAALQWRNSLAQSHETGKAVAITQAKA